MNFTNIIPPPLSPAPTKVARVAKDPLEYLSASRLKSFHLSLIHI